MAFVQKAISANSLGNGSTFVGAPRAGSFTSTNYKVSDDGYVPTSGDLSYLNSRYNDVRYYTGDTPN